MSIFRLGLGSNKYSLMAFAAGIVLLAAVLLLPFLETLFQVAPLTLGKRWHDRFACHPAHRLHPDFQSHP